MDVDFARRGKSHYKGVSDTMCWVHSIVLKTKDVGAGCEGAAVQYWASEDHRIGETSPEKGHKCGMHHMEERQDLQSIFLLTAFSRILSTGDMGKL